MVRRPLEFHGDLDLGHAAHFKGAVGYVTGFEEPEPCSSCVQQADEHSSAEPFFLECVSATARPGTDPSDSSTEFLLQGACATCFLRGRGNNCSLSRGRRHVGEALQRMQERSVKKDPFAAGQASGGSPPKPPVSFFRSPPQIPRHRSESASLNIEGGKVAYDRNSGTFEWVQGDEWQVVAPPGVDLKTTNGRLAAFQFLSRVMARIANEGADFNPASATGNSGAKMTRSASQQAGLALEESPPKRRNVQFEEEREESVPTSGFESASGAGGAPTHVSRDESGIPLRQMSQADWTQHEQELDAPSSQERLAGPRPPQKRGRGRGRGRRG